MRLVLAAVLALAGAAAHGAQGAQGAQGAESARGEEAYTRCLGCHSFEMHRTGPRHCGLFGRRAGAAPGYDYSPAMKRSGIVWNERTLDRFLAAPTKVVPGTTMTYAGVDDPAERTALIAYLKARSAACR